jgi:hypothetical protein
MSHLLVRLLPLLAALACAPGGGVPVGSRPEDSAEDPGPEDSTARTDTGDATDSVDSVDSVEGVDTGEARPPDEVPGVEEPRPVPLCRIELACADAIRDEPKVRCDLTVRDGYGRLEYEGYAGVELRGRSSVSFVKPQYAVELWDASSTPVAANLLGMGAEEDWVFNGIYVDRSLFRNKLTYDLFQAFAEVGDPPLPAHERYAAESAFCELSLNGAWRGIYLLQERIKDDDDRLPLTADGSGGSFLLKTDDSGGGLMSAPEFYGEWFMEYPPPATATAAQRAGVQAWMRGWQAALLSADPGSESAGVPVWLDLDSAVDFVILQEFAKNCDAYSLSVTVWKDVGGKLHFVPWDLDLSFGYPYYDCGAEGWLRYSTAITTLAALPAFEARLVSRWWELRATVLSEESVLARIDGYRATLGDDVDRNFEVWPIDEIQFCWGGRCWLCPISSYDEEYARFREWVLERLAWMDAHIEEY